MVMSRLRIPTFEDLLKKVRQPKTPAVSANVTLDQKQAGEIGHTLAGGWRLQNTGRGISLLSPRGNVFNVNKISPDGKVADFAALKDGKPVKIPPLPPPEPIDESVRQRLKDFEVKRGNISPISGAVTGTTPFEGELELPEVAKIEADIQSRNIAITEGKAFYPSLIHGEEVSVAGFNPADIKPKSPSFGERVETVTGGMIKADDDAGARFQERAGQLSGIVGWANRPTALFNLTPAEIVGIATIVTGGVQAIKSLTEFGRQPQVKAISQVAKAAEKAGKPIAPQTVQDAKDALRTAYNLQKMGASEAANEILTKFNVAYTKAFGGLGTTTQASTAVRQVIAKYEPFIPRGTQTGAMAFGGVPGKPTKELGQSIAGQLSIRFDGIQKAPGLPDTLTFKDPVTKGNISGNTLAEVKAELDRVRATMPAVESQGTDLSQAEIDKMVRAKFESAKTGQNVPVQARDFVKSKESLEWGTKIVDLSIKDDFSDPTTLRDMLPTLSDGLYTAGDNYVYEVINHKAKILPQYRERFIGGKQVITERPLTPSDITQVPIFHGSTSKDVTLDNISLEFQGRNYPGIGNEFNGVYFTTRPSEAYGWATVPHQGIRPEGTIVEARIKPGAKVITYKEVKGRNTQELLSDGVDVILKYPKGGDYSEIIVLNPKALQSPGEAKATPAPLHQALIQEGEQLVQKAEKISPQDANVASFKAAVEKAKSATDTESRTNALREMEKLEPEVQKIMAPSTTGVTKIEPSYVNLTEGQTLVNQAGERWTIIAIDKTGVPARWGYTIKGETIDLTRTMPLGEVERYYKIEQPSAIPMAPSTSVQTGLPGMGVQAQVQMFGEVSGKESRKAPLIEVAKPKKGTEPLPGQMEAFKEDEEQAVADFKAGEEAAAKREMLRSDPVAVYRFKMTGRNVGLDSLISIKEQSFPEYLTVKQAQALNPEKSFAKYTVKGTKFYNKVPKDAALDQLTKEFNMTPDEIADRVMEIRAEKRAARQAPLTPAPEPTSQEKAVATTFGEVKVFNEKQKEQLIRLIGEYLENPSTDNAWELTRELRRETRAGQAIRLNERTQELLAEGVVAEEAMTQAKREIMSGELPKMTTDYFDDMTDTMRVVLFDKVYQVLKDEPFERLSTQDALTNALAGRPIPREPGTKGGSAFTRLQRVFGKETPVLKAIEKMAEEKKPLRDVVQGAFHEVGRDPIPIDPAILDYLRALPTTGVQEKISFPLPGNAQGLFTYNPTGNLGLNLQAEQLGLTIEKFQDIQAKPDSRSLATMLLDYRRKNLMSDEELLRRVKEIDWETITIDESLKLQHELWLAKGRPGPTRPEFFDRKIWDTFEEKRMPGFNFDEKSMIVKVLQEIGMSPIDLGNFLRANMSSVDFSFFRTGRMLGSGHPVAFYKSLLSGWKATWSQKEADAHWRAITLDPDYELYERIRKDFSYDPLRVPAKEREVAFRKSEEFGFPIEERFIPRMGQKLPHIKMSGRGFETALNDLVWSVWKQQLAMARRYAMKVASGKIKMKPGEAWDITREMTDHQRMLGDMIQRASLNINVGKVRADFTPASPALGGALFAPRAKWARLIVGRHLFSANPRVRMEALKDMSVWAASTAGIVLLGAMLGLWDVETDPVSGEFVSIRIGKVRIDPWEGHRQIVNLYSRLITGQTKSTITGKKTETDIMTTLGNFVRSSLNVLPGLLTDIKMGKTFTGEKTDITNLEQTARRVLPFSLSQIWETFQESWRLGLATLPLSVLGESISAYDTAESLSAEAIAKLGKVDIVTREEKVQKAKEAGFTPSKIAEIMADDKAYDMKSLRSDINSSTAKGGKGLSPIVNEYWSFKEQDDKYAKMSTKEQESYLKANPGYVTDRLFWGETTEIPDAKTANDLVSRAEKYGFDLDTIPAFQKADKTFKIGGKEVKRQVTRIPSDRNLWPAYFDYKNLPEDTTQTARDKYLNDTPDIEAFLVVNTERTTISSLEAAEKAAGDGVPLDQIPAFSLTDKGKERIPSNKTMWPSFFDYNDLPGTSYLAMTQAQVDAGLLPEKYLKEWETYHSLKTDTAKDYFRKAHKEVSKGDWRDDFRRANPEFDKWLQENLDMKPLKRKTIAARRSSASTPVRAAISSGGGSTRLRAGKVSYPKFKKVKVSSRMSVGAPRAPRI